MSGIESSERAGMLMLLAAELDRAIHIGLMSLGACV